MVLHRPAFPLSNCSPAFVLTVILIEIEGTSFKPDHSKVAGWIRVGSRGCAISLGRLALEEGYFSGVDGERWLRIR